MFKSINQLVSNYFKNEMNVLVFFMQKCQTFAETSSIRKYVMKVKLN